MSSAEASADTPNFDLLVLGAGMAGLSAGGLAAEAGARALVVDKAKEPGGSAKLAGYLWTVADARVLRGWDDGNPRLGRVVIDNFAEGVAWMRARGMIHSELQPVLHGRGYALDVSGHLRQCRKDIRSAAQGRGAVTIAAVHIS